MRIEEFKNKYREHKHKFHILYKDDLERGD